VTGRAAPGRVMRVGRALDAEIVSARPVGGGDSSEAWLVELGAGTRPGSVFVKTNPDAPGGLFDAEADGLARLGRTDAVRVPEVLAVADDGPDRFIVLEWVEPGPPGPSHDRDLGRELAALHAHSADRFGLERDNFIGRRPQTNRWCATWAELYGTWRLAPMARLSRDAGVLSPELSRGIDRLIDQLPDRLGPPEPPALVHGDLWGGNAIADREGRPWLIDPAVYFGHREVDLAMMRLFGGFGLEVFAAYAEAFPLAGGSADRVALHQLYPLLVHTLHPAPAGYVAAVTRIVSTYS
jgi:fructosamine-3-kinase